MGLQKQLKDAESALAAKADGSRLLKEEVTEDDIAEVISKWTGGSCLCQGGGGCFHVVGRSVCPKGQGSYGPAYSPGVKAAVIQQLPFNSNSCTLQCSLQFFVCCFQPLLSTLWSVVELWLSRGETGSQVWLWTCTPLAAQIMAVVFHGVVSQLFI
jgi:hypothetical protein